MVTKLFKRGNATDVFDTVVEEQDEPEAETPVADADAADSTAEPGTDEPVESVESVDDTNRTEDTATGRRSWIPRTLAATAGVVLAAALVLSGFLAWQSKQRNDADAAGRAALATAQSYATTLTSLDIEDIDQNFAQVLDGATGEFKDMYSQSANQLRQALIDNKAQSHGTVIDSAIKSATPSKVEVLLFIDQTIVNSVNPTPRIDRSRVAMTLEHVDNQWLASKVDIK